MRKLLFFLFLLMINAGIIKAQSWSVDADYAEGCECNSPCPCIFGMDPSHRQCMGNSVIQINKGHYDDVNVDGLKLFLTFSLGEWSKVYIDEKATKKQSEALMKLLKQPNTIAFFFRAKILSVENVPISIEQTDSTYTYSVPNSYAQIKYIKGRNNKPIGVQNLPGNFLTNNKLAQTIALNHKGDDKAFNHSGTHGLVSHFTASSDQ